MFLIFFLFFKVSDDGGWRQEEEEEEEELVLGMYTDHLKVIVTIYEMKPYTHRGKEGLEAAATLQRYKLLSYRCN